jgi:hypothetical protein
VLTGGPRGPPPAGMAATVTATRGGRPVARQTVASGQRFALVVPEGTYRLWIGGAGVPCADATVTVSAGADRTVSMVCWRK